MKATIQDFSFHRGILRCRGCRPSCASPLEWPGLALPTQPPDTWPLVREGQPVGLIYWDLLTQPLGRSKPWSASEQYWAKINMDGQKHVGLCNVEQPLDPICRDIWHLESQGTVGFLGKLRRFDDRWFSKEEISSNKSQLHHFFKFLLWNMPAERRSKIYLQEENNLRWRETKAPLPQRRNQTFWTKKPRNKNLNRINNTRKKIHIPQNIHEQTSKNRPKTQNNSTKTQQTPKQN